VHRAALLTPLIASLLVGCHPLTPARSAGNNSLRACASETTPALRVSQVLAIQEDRAVIIVQGYLIKGSDICTVCEDGPNTYMSTDSVRLADSAAAVGSAGLGLNSKRENYHCWRRGSEPPLYPCSVRAAGQHVRIRARYVFDPTGKDGSYLSEPDICELPG